MESRSPTWPPWIDVSGGATTPGSSTDAAQQGHAATSNGVWHYLSGNSPGGGPFSGGNGAFTQWDSVTGRYWSGPGSATRIGATIMQPGATIGDNPYSTRQWSGTGQIGQTLRVFGDFTTFATTVPESADNNGVDVHVLVDGFVFFSDTLHPNLDPAPFDFTFVASSSPVVRFAVGPQGAGPASPQARDFFNDAANMRATIEQVPEPSTCGLLALAVAGLALRRRR